MTECLHNYVRKTNYTWECSKCDQTIIPLLVLFSPEFGKLFLEKGYEAYRIYKGEVFREIK